MIFIVQNPLPDPEILIDNSTGMAWEQIILWSSAATGILLTVLLAKSFLSK